MIQEAALSHCIEALERKPSGMRMAAHSHFQAMQVGETGRTWGPGKKEGWLWEPTEGEEWWLSPARDPDVEPWALHLHQLPPCWDPTSYHQNWGPRCHCQACSGTSWVQHWTRNAFYRRNKARTHHPALPHFRRRVLRRSKHSPRRCYNLAHREVGLAFHLLHWQPPFSLKNESTHLRLSNRYLSLLKKRNDCRKSFKLSVSLFG